MFLGMNNQVNEWNVARPTNNKSCSPWICLTVTAQHQGLENHLVLVFWPHFLRPPRSPKSTVTADLELPGISCSRFFSSWTFIEKWFLITDFNSLSPDLKSPFYIKKKTHTQRKKMSSIRGSCWGSSHSMLISATPILSTWNSAWHGTVFVPW